MGSPVRAERGRPTGKETERGLKGVKRRRGNWTRKREEARAGAERESKSERSGASERMKEQGEEARGKRATEAILISLCFPVLLL